MAEETRKKLIAVCELGRLGDIVTSEPIFHYLKGRYPERTLRWYTKACYVDLLRYSPDIDEIVCVKNEEEYLERKAQFPADTLAFELNFRNLPGGKVPVIGDFAHTSLLTRFALTAGLPPLNETPVFHFAPDVKMPPLPERYVLLHCTPGGKARQWRVRNWRKLADFILSSGVPVVEIGEIRVIQSRHPDFHDLTGRLNLQSAAAIVRSAELLVGVESGFAHIANAVGTPSIIISGKWHGYNDYNLYSGRFGRCEGMVFARMDNVEPAQFPYEVAEAIVQSALAGKPLDSEACRRYCRERQESDYPQNAFYHIREFFIQPWRKLFLALERHALKHQKQRG